MGNSLFAALILLTMPLAPPAPAMPEPVTISTGPEVKLSSRLTPERPTVFVFLKRTSTLERAFLDDLRRKCGEKITFGVIWLASGEEPIARQYQVSATPTALVYDRRGRLVARSSEASEIETATRKAAQVMRIDWAEDGDARLAEVSRLLGGRRPAPGILRTMSLRPEYLASIHEVSQKAHFADGFLKRRTKEMIATYVSSLNRCKY
jgi:hypothetical protein